LFKERHPSRQAGRNRPDSYLTGKIDYNQPLALVTKQDATFFNGW
jgi:hypothetical protein